VTTLDLSPDELLTTTRTVRKRLDLEKPVPLEVIRECIEGMAAKLHSFDGWKKTGKRGH
jgi:hypothetical protein